MNILNEFYNKMTGLLFNILEKFRMYKGRHFQYRQIKARYLSVRNLMPEIVNIVFAFFGSKRSFRPVVVGVEPLNICNLSCMECEVNRSMKRPKGHMSFELFKSIIDRHPHFLRINLTNYGEPLLHKDLLKMISYASSKKNVCTIFTNATLLSDEAAKGLVDSGLKVICFSIDGVDEVYKKVRGHDYKDVAGKIDNFLRINKEMGRPVLTEMNMVEFGPTIGQWAEVKRAWGSKIDVLMKTPLMQGKIKRKKRCLNLWRSLVVLQDGAVVPCCVDIDMQMKLGDIKENSLLEIFNGDKMRDLRNRHIRHDFPELCSHCSEFFG